jgi:hypothetical protein
MRFDNKALYKRGELRQKQAAASSTNGVVGSTGKTTPNAAAISATMPAAK